MPRQIGNASEADREQYRRLKKEKNLPVQFVTRTQEVRDWLKRESDRGKKQVKRIVFEGERFAVMSVRRRGEGARQPCSNPAVTRLP